MKITALTLAGLLLATPLAHADDADAEKVRKLIVQLSGEDLGVRRKAVAGLGRINSVQAVDALVALVHGDKELRPAAGRALLRQGRRAVKPLLAMMKAAPQRRKDVIALLGRIGGDEVVKPLTEALQDRRVDVRVCAAVSLGHAGGDKAVEVLVAALKDPDVEVRRVAVRALGDLAPPKAAKAVKALAKDTDANVRLCVRWAERRIAGDKTKAGQEVYRQLKKRCPRLQFPGIPLGDVIQFFRDISNLNIHVDWHGLGRIGINQRSPVTINARDIPLRDAITDVLTSVDEARRPVWLVDRGIILITTLGRHRQWTRRPEMPTAAGPADRSRARAELKKVLPKLHFPGIGLGDVAEFYREIRTVRMLIDWPSLKAIGITPREAVNIHLRDVPLQTAFDRCLLDVDPAGGVAYALTGDAMVVSTTTRLPKLMARKVPAGSTLAEQLILAEMLAFAAAGGDLHAAGTGYKTTRLHEAARWGDALIIKHLLAKGADVNTRAAARQTPLHFAARHGRPAAAAVLLEAGAVVNAADEAGRTPLHYAAQYGAVDVARRLLAKGADPTREDRGRRTPLALAPKDAKAVIELLQQHAPKK